MKILSKYQTFCKRDVYDCRLNSLKEWLRHYDIYVNSFDILALSESLNFKYGMVDMKKMNFTDIPYITVSNMNIQQKLFEKIDAPIKAEKIPSNDEGLHKIINLLDNNIPVLFYFDSTFFSTRKKEYLVNIKYLSLLLAIGYDTEKKQILVALPDTAHTDIYTCVSFDDFQENRAIICSPYAPECACFYSNNNISFTQSAINTNVLLGLSNISKNMLKGTDIKTLKTIDMTFHDFKSGIPAMKKYNTDFKNKYIDSIVPKTENKRYQMELLFLRNSLLHGSYTAFREEFTHTLKQVAQNNKLNELHTVQKSFEAIHKKWKKYIYMLGKLGSEKCINISMSKKAYKLFQEIIVLEEKNYIEIIKIIEPIIK